MSKEIIYSAMGGSHDPVFGRYEHPIKAFIEEESNKWKDRKTILNTLYNVETSKRYAETITGESDFGLFQAKKEGQGAANDNVEATFPKTIEHIEFAKSFSITRKAADDAKFGIAAEISSKPKKFIAAYYKTKIFVASQALIKGTGTSMNINGENVDLTTGDKLPLFSSKHLFSTQAQKGKTQSNFFYKKFGFADSTSAVEDALGIMANKMRNFRSENNEILGYVANVVIIPCNRPKLESQIKKVVGSERTVGSDHNDINTQYGNWTVVVLDGWETADDRFMIMSDEANRELMGNMFYNRVKLDIQSHIDFNTRNYEWNGYCRFGVGFTTWKHIALLVDGASADGASALE